MGKSAHHRKPSDVRNQNTLGSDRHPRADRACHYLGGNAMDRLAPWFSAPAWHVASAMRVNMRRRRRMAASPSWPRPRLEPFFKRLQVRGRNRPSRRAPRFRSPPPLPDRGPARLAAAGRPPGALDEEVDLGIHDDLVLHWDRWAAAAGWSTLRQAQSEAPPLPVPIRLRFLSVMVDRGLHRNAMTASMRVRRLVWSNPWRRQRAL
jgi:hypothetical protein